MLLLHPRRESNGVLQRPVCGARNSENAHYHTFLAISGFLCCEGVIRDMFQTRGDSLAAISGILGCLWHHKRLFNDKLVTIIGQWNITSKREHELFWDEVAYSDHNVVVEVQLWLLGPFGPCSCRKGRICSGQNMGFLQKPNNCPKWAVLKPNPVQSMHLMSMQHSKDG